MAIRDLVFLPDPRLREECVLIDVVDEDIRELASDMFETMYDAPGIGLAAPQIGVMKRIVVVDVSERAERETGEVDSEANDPSPAEPASNPLALINPEIIATSEKRSVYQEGCLSIPDVYEDVERPEVITVRYLDLEGAEQTLEADGLLATCIQHEIDHINGVLFIDYLSRLKRERIKRKFAKMAKQREREAS